MGKVPSALSSQDSPGFLFFALGLLTKKEGGKMATASPPTTADGLEEGEEEPGDGEEVMVGILDVLGGLVPADGRAVVGVPEGAGEADG